MAKHSLFGSGKNALHDTGHIRSTKYQNGNQGFGEKNIGHDTVPGPMKGAPLSNKVEQEVNKKRVLKDGKNPFNRFEGNAQGVLGDKVVDQDGGRLHDSPVPASAEHPHLDIVTKAAEVASYKGGSVGGYAGPQGNTDQTIGETWPENGVMARD